GGTVACPACGRELAIPRRSTDTPAPAALTAAARAGTVTTQLAGNHVTFSNNLIHFKCGCGGKLKAYKADAGELVDCPRCGRELAIPRMAARPRPAPPPAVTRPAALPPVVEHRPAPSPPPRALAPPPVILPAPPP